MSSLVHTSCLFVIPIALATYYQIYDVAIASTVCFLTSMIYHSTHTSPSRCIDMITVNAVAIAYTCHAVWLIQLNTSFLLVPIIAMSTLAVYFATPFHMPVHFMAIFGICVYVVLRHRYVM